VVQRVLPPGAFGLVVVGLGGWWFAPGVRRDRAPALLGVLPPGPVFKGIRPATKNHPGGLPSACLIATQGQAVGGMAAGPEPRGREPGGQGAAICAWLLLQPVHQAPSRYLPPPKCFGAVSIWAFFPAIGCARDLSDGLLAPDLVRARRGRQAQAWTTLAWPACWSASPLTSAILCDWPPSPAAIPSREIYSPGRRLRIGRIGSTNTW